MDQAPDVSQLVRLLLVATGKPCYRVLVREGEFCEVLRPYTAGRRRAGGALPLDVGGDDEGRVRE